MAHREEKQEKIEEEKGKCLHKEFFFAATSTKTKNQNQNQLPAAAVAAAAVVSLYGFSELYRFRRLETSSWSMAR